MFGRSAKTALLTLGLLSSATPALARSHNFFTDTPFGLGFKAGVEKRPGTDFSSGAQSANSLNPYYAFEPFLDFGNFVLKPYLSLHMHPLIEGSGTDQAKALTYTDSSNASTFSYGLEIMLVPYVSKDMTERLYLLLGGGNATTSLKNQRFYANGTAYTERASGSGIEYITGAGYEFFFVQNYSIALEAGYRRFKIEKFGYKSTSDVTGHTRSEGETAVGAETGLPKKFHEESPYFTIAFNLNF